MNVIQLYKYAVEHNLLGEEVKVVLDIINRERNPVDNNRLCFVSLNNFEDSIVNPINNISTLDFSFKEYTTEEVLELFNS